MGSRRYPVVLRVAVCLVTTTTLFDLVTMSNAWTVPRLSRRSFILATTTATQLIGGAAHSFEGGVGGLGKTKPDTGVVISTSMVPVQSADGVVSAELLVGSGGGPLLVTFTSPWPLLGTAGGLETRNVQSSASAFVQVIESVKPNSMTKTSVATLLDPLFANQGKFGAYGSPFDVKVHKLSSSDDASSFTCEVSFTTFTPGMRETDRRVLIRGVRPTSSCCWVLLVTGTTQQGFVAQRDVFSAVGDSFSVIPAPPMMRRSSSSSGI